MRITAGLVSTLLLALPATAADVPQRVGWGFARFVGPTLKPCGEGKSFVQECIGCHVPVAANDYLFTSLAPRPR